jgi:adenosylmethionine-8-amino-7-oxononanoate aminotransferase
MPDIICMSKSLTAGVVPMAITSCSKLVYDAFYDDELKKGLFHGHTYSANPLACTAAIAGIDLLLSEQIQQQIAHISEKHKAFEIRIKDHPKVKTTRSLGVIFALDLDLSIDRYGKFRDKLFQFFMDEGVFLRPLGNTIYILAPFIITDEELDKIYDVIEKSLEII